MNRIVVAIFSLAILGALVVQAPSFGWQFFAVSIIFVAYAAVPYFSGSKKNSVRFLLIVFSGLWVEFFAWLNNFLSQTPYPPLFHPLLAPDLLVGVVFYSSMAFGWILLEKWWGLRYKDIFFLTFLLSVCIEQFGAILLSFNIVLYVYVFLVYLSMVLPAFLFVRPVDREVPLWKRYVFGLVLLFVLSIFGTNILSASFSHMLQEKPSTARIF